MPIFKKKNKLDLNNDELSERLQDSEEKRQVLLTAVRVLLIFIKEFSFDLEEIGAKGFKENIDELTKKISSEEKAKKLQSIFDKHKKLIQSFVIQEGEYLQDREGELKNIIDLLSKAITSLNIENQDFNEQVYKQSEKIEQITLLDDIKKIKTSLGQEIDKIRETIRNKQTHDDNQIEVLSNKISSLKRELKKAQKESTIDGLTGIYNRRALDSYLKDLVERNTIASSPFSFIIMDIDNFKDINDRHGHPTGDRVILALVEKCKEYIRRDDFLARYGGEEFVIILPGASLRNAKKKANHIRKAIEASRYSINDTKDSPVISFTVSVGVSVYRKNDIMETVTKRADKSLYAAKQSGKNRVFSEKDL